MPSPLSLGRESRWKLMATRYNTGTPPKQQQSENKRINKYIHLHKAIGHCL